VTVRVYKNGSWKSPNLIQVRDNSSWNQVNAVWRYTSTYGWRQVYPNVTEPSISITSITTTATNATINWEVSESDTVLVEVYLSTNLTTPVFSILKNGNSPNSQLVSGLTTGSTYLASLTATATSGVQAFASQEFIAQQETPSAPQNISASTGRIDGIQVSWTAPASAGASAITEYQIQRNQDPVAILSQQEWTGGIGNVSSYLATNVDPSINYYFRVRAVNSYGPGEPSAVSNAGSKVAADELAVAANRTYISTNDSTLIVARIKNNGSNVNVANIPITFFLLSSTYGSFSSSSSVISTTINTNSNGQASVTYYSPSTAGSYGVFVSTPGLPLSGITIGVANVPGPVLNLSASNPTQTFGPPSVVWSVSWSAPSDNGGSAITDYEFATDLDADGTAYDFGAWASTGNTLSRSVLVFGGQQAYFKVRAVNALGGGSESQITLNSSPSIPQNFTGSATSSTTASLSWSAPASNGGSSITSYQFQRNTQTTPGANWDDIGLVTSRNPTGLDPSTTYYFRVRAVNANGIGEYAQTSITTTASSPTPSPSPIVIPPPPTEPPGVTPLPPTSPYFPFFPFFPFFPYFPPGPVVPLPPPNPRPPLSIGFDTKILTSSGYVPVQNILVGDELISIDIAEITTDGATFDIQNWSSENFTNKGFATTYVTDIVARQIDGPSVTINGDIFSSNHDILVRKNGIHRFEPALDIDNSYEIFDYDIQDWVPVTEVEINENSTITVYSIDCEPYDVFFTNNALVYNRKEFDG
jgi:hypothetical protein